MKKNKLFIISINILVIIITLLIVDVFVAYKNHNFMCNYIKQTSSNSGFERNENPCPQFTYRFGLMSFEEFLKKEKQDYKKYINQRNKSIIVFGCSFAHGSWQNGDSGNFTDILNKYSKRYVYNRAFGGFGPAPMLWQVENNEFYNNIKIEPEYIIYVFISYQPQRITTDKWGDSSSRPIYIGYNQKNGKLVENKSPLLLLCRLNFIKKLIVDHYMKKYSSENGKEELFDLFKMHLSQSKVDLQKKYPNTKFIIIKYPMGIDSTQALEKYFYETDKWEELKEEGFIVYDLKKEINEDLTDKKYLLPDLHPNQKAWEIIVPKLINDLNI